MRGNPPAFAASVPCSGSIPACAGEPHGSGASLILSAVYPRVCGGTAAVEAGKLPRQGLSPRVRGNRIRRDDDVAALGSIPACAGEPARSSTTAS